MKTEVDDVVDIKTEVLRKRNYEKKMKRAENTPRAQTVQVEEVDDVPNIKMKTGMEDVHEASSSQSVHVLPVGLREGKDFKIVSDVVLRRQPLLNGKVFCSDEILATLTAQTIDFINEKSSLINDGGAAVVVDMIDEKKLHSALDLAGVPEGLKRGETERESFRNFQNWLVSTARDKDDYTNIVTEGVRVGDGPDVCIYFANGNTSWGHLLQLWMSRSWFSSVHKAGIGAFARILFVLQVEGGAAVAQISFLHGINRFSRVSYGDLRRQMVSWARSVT